MNYYTINAYSASEIRTWFECKKLYDKRYIDKLEDEETKAMKTGTMLHAAILENGYFKEHYVLNAGIKLNTKEGKAWKAAYPDKEVLSKEDTDIVQNIQRAMRDYHSDYFPLNQSANLYEFLKQYATKEQSIYSEQFELALNLVRAVKLKPDAYCIVDDTVYIFDLKSMATGDFNYYLNVVERKFLDIQAAWYSHILKSLIGAKNAVFFNIFLEKKGANRIKVMPYNSEYLKSVWGYCIQGIREIEAHKINGITEQKQARYIGDAPEYEGRNEERWFR